MWKHRTIQTLFHIEHPILQAPMASASNPELVANVSNAGALGGLGAAAMRPEVLRTNIHDIRRKTDKPFNVNLFCSDTEEFDHHAQPGPGLIKLLEGYHREMGLDDLPVPGPMFGPVKEQLEVLIDEKVPVISFHFGINGNDIEQIKRAGLKTICSATTVDEALELERAGVDAIIAQGSEAGGHRGTFSGDYRNALIGTLALVPEIVDSVSIPVIAAGGIMDARGMVACAALGASAVQMGTAFLSCPETNLPQPWLNKLLESRAHDTIITDILSGKPARGIQNRYIREAEALPLLPYPLQYSISGQLRNEAIKNGNTDFLAMWSGQGVGLSRPQPSAELIADLVSGSKRLLEIL